MLLPRTATLQLRGFLASIGLPKLKRLHFSSALKGGLR
jgi:hypothetical protein